MMASRPAGSRPNAECVLSAAVVQIAELWQLPNTTLGTIIGLSASTVARLRTGRYHLTFGSKPFELAQHLLRLFQSLDSWLGRDEVSAASWLTTRNLDLEARPIDLLPTVRGLLRTNEYVDALRARV